MFGPYIAILSSYKDQATFKNSNGEIVDDITISGFSVKQKTNGNATLNAGIYNPIDIGFVAGFGAEIRLWRRTVLALQMRADIGISDVERTKKLKITYDSDKTKEVNYSQWQGKYSKYIVPNATDIITGYVPNRPPTKNFSAGVFLSIRKYLSY
jgi:hypothetical protein